MLESAVVTFKHKEGRNPENLHEMVILGYINEIPDDGGISWEYDRITGIIK